MAYTAWCRARDAAYTAGADPETTIIGNLLLKYPSSYDNWLVFGKEPDDMDAEFPNLGAHLQCYLVFKKRQSITACKTQLGSWATIMNFTVATESERSLQTVEEYVNDPHKDGVSHEEDSFRFGIFPDGKPGKTDTEFIRKQCLDGKTLKRFIQEGELDMDQLVKYQRIIQYSERAFAQVRGTDFTPRIIWLESAESGTGKSFYVLQGGLLQDFGISLDDCYFWNGSTGGSTGWVDEGAIGKTCWIMQEAAGQHCTPHALKDLWDRGAMQMQCKGGMVQCLATTWVITTNFSLREWWGKLKLDKPEEWERHMTALERRVREWGVRPNFKGYLRNWRLEQRLTQQGGLKVRANGQLELRRITPEPVIPMDATDFEGMSQHERDTWLAQAGYTSQEREDIADMQRTPFDA